MGHLINPISTRLGLSSFWLSSWSRFALTTFSYNLMFDNVIRNLILWVFANSRVAVQMSIVGVFLSHFKIVRRSNSIHIFIYLVLNSSSFLKSQSVEVDSSVANFNTDLQIFANQYLCKATDVFFSKQFSNNLFLRKIFGTYVSQLLKKNFNFFFKFNSCFSYYRVDLDVSFLKNIKFITAGFLSRFIARRLSFGFELNRVLGPIVIDLSKLVNFQAFKILGFKIACSGRFNKTQMAAYSWEKYGPIRLNNFSAVVDYSLSKVFLRYGLCGIKVWVFNYAYPFQSYKSKMFKLFLNKQFFYNLTKYSSNLKINFIIIKFIFKLFFFEMLANFNLTDKEKMVDEYYKFISFSSQFINDIQVFRKKNVN